MDSVQTMRWILVNATAVAGVVAIVLGYVLSGVVLLFGCSLHTAHWWLTKREAAVETVPVEE